MHFSFTLPFFSTLLKQVHVIDYHIMMCSRRVDVKSHNFAPHATVCDPSLCRSDFFDRSHHRYGSHQADDSASTGTSSCKTVMCTHRERSAWSTAVPNITSAVESREQRWIRAHHTFVETSPTPFYALTFTSELEIPLQLNKPESYNSYSAKQSLGQHSCSLSLKLQSLLQVSENV